MPEMPPKTTLSPLNPSPKRKRDPPYAPPQLNTSTPPPPQSLTVGAGEDSPRSVVANQLRDLDIKNGAIRILDFGKLAEDAIDAEARKRMKLEEMPIRGGREDKFAVRIPHGNSESSLESHGRDAGMTSLPRRNECVEGPSNAMRSEKAISETHTSPERRKSISPPPPSLTWQDDEITGHLVDPSQDPEDDGTGLNGIGFKPTPALAHARAQRRRQQVLEWRAREAKEARQKRSERRRRGAGGGGLGSDVEDVKERMGRIVRFAT